MRDGTVLSVSPLGEKAVTVAVAEGDSAVTVTVGRSVWERLSMPGEGDVLSPEALASLKQAGRRREAYGIAVRLLEGGDMNRRTLASKLVRRGVLREDAVFAVNRMQELGYINELAQAERYAASMSRRNLWGRRRIVAELTARGYSAEDAEAGVDAAVTAGAIDFSESRAQLVRRLAARGIGGDKLRAALYRYGYCSED